MKHVRSLNVTRHSIAAIASVIFFKPISANPIPLCSSLSLNVSAYTLDPRGTGGNSGNGLDSQAATLNPLAASATVSFAAAGAYPALSGSESWTASFTNSAQGAVSIKSVGLTTGSGPSTLSYGDVTFGLGGSGVDNGFYYTFVADASGDLVVDSNTTTSAPYSGMSFDTVQLYLGWEPPGYFTTNSQSFPTGAGQVTIPITAGSTYTLEITNYTNCGGAGACNIQDSGSFTFSIPSGNSSAVTAPSVACGGIVPVDSSVNTIQPGEWVSIYGTNLASSTATWNGDFPKSLGGTSVAVNGTAAFLSFVSPTQINLQAPDDKSTGSVPVVVTTAGGTVTSAVTLAQFAPSFLLLDSKHVAGIILRTDGSGAYGGGTYDILGPTGSSLGYATVAAKAGDTVALFGTGFGPTNPVVSAGQAFSGAAPTTNPVNVLINNVGVTPSFAGLSGAGLYQMNLTVPSDLGTGDVSLAATVGGVQTPTGVVISLQ
jgi:uncharacterized protein (TIGR03437 family)